MAEMLSPPLDVDRDMLLERLSEFLEHEHAGAKLYERALERVERGELKDRIAEFLDQTREHERVLEHIIGQLGGDPTELSELAELGRMRTSGLFDAIENAEGDLTELNALQCLMVAEWICQKNWTFLSQIARRATDEEIREILREPVVRVEEQEDDHYRWCERQVENVSLDLLRELEEEEMEREDEGDEGGRDEAA
jgi:rubrerythrin